VDVGKAHSPLVNGLSFCLESNERTPMILPTASQPHPDATLLIVDDDPGVQQSCRLLLRRQGYRTLEAQDGATALGMVKAHPIDVCLIDLTLPDGHGLDLLERLRELQPQALASYGVDVKFLGIKRIGLPESITEKVFERMKEERQRVVQKFQADGERQAADIRSGANRERAELLAQADAKVTELRGEAEAQAAKSLAVFKENPELAIFLLKIRALEDTLKERTTLILDQRTPPLDLLDGAPSKPQK